LFYNYGGKIINFLIALIFNHALIAF